MCQEAGNIKQLRSAFETSAKAPYSHCVLENFCNEARLRAVHDEAQILKKISRLLIYIGYMLSY